jgi:hypothetical protein
MEYLLTIRDFSSHQTILQDQDNNLIYWPKDKLPKNAVIGQLISFKIEAENSQLEKNLAKQILGEILGEQS